MSGAIPADSVDVSRLGKVVAAVVIGLSIGTLVPPEPVALPMVGSVSGIVAGFAGLVVGGGLYGLARRSASGCGCDGECRC